MTVEIVPFRENPKPKVPTTHPDWVRWMDESCYTHAQAREELGLANGTFYRRIAKAPTLVDRLAMAALFEGLEPWTCES